MFLVPDGDELEIADAAATYLADTMPIARLHRPDSADMDPAMRASLGEMGWFALALPEAAGGSGLTAIEHALFFREVGRQCGPIDVLAQSLAALAIDDEVLRANILRGATGVALAVSGADESRVFGSPEATLVLSVSRERVEIFAQYGGANNVRRSLDPATSIALASQFANPLVSTEGPLFWQLGQLGVAAMLVGIAEAALKYTARYAKQRTQFETPISEFQMVQERLAEMKTNLDAGEALVYLSAERFDKGQGEMSLGAESKLFSAQMATKVGLDAIQILGGYGYMKEYPVERYMRDAKLMEIGAGTNEVMRLIVAKDLLKKVGE